MTVLTHFNIWHCHKMAQACVQLHDKTKQKLTLLGFTFIQIIYKPSVHISQRTHTMSIIKINTLMTFREVIGSYCVSHVKQKYTIWKNMDFLNVTEGGIYTYQWALNS